MPSTEIVWWTRLFLDAIRYEIQLKIIILNREKTETIRYKFIYSRGSVCFVPNFGNTTKVS